MNDQKPESPEGYEVYKPVFGSSLPQDHIQWCKRHGAWTQSGINSRACSFCWFARPVDKKDEPPMDAKLSGRWVPVSEAMPTRDDGCYHFQRADGSENYDYYRLKAVLLIINDPAKPRVVAWFHVIPPAPVKSSEDAAFEKYQMIYADENTKELCRHHFMRGVEFARKNP